MTVTVYSSVFSSLYLQKPPEQLSNLIAKLLSQLHETKDFRLMKHCLKPTLDCSRRSGVQARDQVMQSTCNTKPRLLAVPFKVVEPPVLVTHASRVENGPYIFAQSSFSPRLACVNKAGGSTN